MDPVFRVAGSSQPCITACLVPGLGQSGFRADSGPNPGRTPWLERPPFPHPLLPGDPAWARGPSVAEVPAAPGAEEEEGGQVRDGGDDHRPAHLYCLVPSALHVSGQICRRGHQPAPGRLGHNYPGRVPGNRASLRGLPAPPAPASALPSRAFPW